MSAEQSTPTRKQPEVAFDPSVVGPLSIGSLPLATPILQAPIAGFTDQDPAVLFHPVS